MKSVKQILVVLFVYSSIAVAQSSTEKELIALENRFNEALVQADLNTIANIEADDLVFTDAAGMVTSKADELQSLKSGDVKFQSITMDSTRVANFGNVAVVTGRLVEKAQFKNADISGTYRFTDVWAKRNGKWVHVAGQETLVNAPAAPSASGASNAADVQATLSTLIKLQLQYHASLLDPDLKTW